MENNEIRFSKRHMWIRHTGMLSEIGLSNYAQEKLGDIMFINLPDKGEHLYLGSRFGDIESTKTVSDLISPVEGIVVEVNEALIDEPDRINEESYGSWLVRVRAEKLLPDLLNIEQYEEYLKSL